MDRELERFAKYRSTRGGPNRCWLYKGYTDRHGYGHFWLLRTRMYAHRAAYILASGTVLGADQVVMHTCDNPRCVNPHHLRLGTHAKNVADRVAKQRSATRSNGTWKGGRPKGGSKRVGKIRGKRLDYWKTHEPPKFLFQR